MREGGQEEVDMGDGSRRSGYGGKGSRRSRHGEGLRRSGHGEEGQEKADMGVLRRSGYRGRPEYRHNKCK